MKTVWVALAALLLAAGPAAADQADARALRTFEAAQHKPGRVVQHLDLGGPFATRTPWTFVAIQGPTVKGVYGPEDDEPGAIMMCLAHAGILDCSGPSFPSAKFWPVGNWEKDIDEHHALAVKIAFARQASRAPMLQLKTTSLPCGDGCALISTYLLGYDRKTDRFVGLFANGTGRNMNERTSLIESGPLTGSVIVDLPTPDAPYGYFVTVYQPAEEGAYVQRLRYRSRTRYNDGNPLSVIDSEMPEILRRLKLWKVGDPLPQPLERPVGCNRVELRRGVEWCAP